MKDPLTMPTSGAALQEFEPQRVDFTAPEASGRIGGVQAGFPLWLAVWTLGKFGPDISDAWRAFFASLRGATRRFLGRPKDRPFPKAHIAGFAGMTRAGGGSFDGSATSWSETLNSDDDAELTLQGMPDGLELSIGDYIDFRYAATDAEVAGVPWRALVRVTEGGVADVTGEIMVIVEPPVPAAVPPGAIAHLDNPACVMALVTDKSRLDAIDRRLAVRGGTIVGLQDIRG
jgi:hypothetical protein